MSAANPKRHHRALQRGQTTYLRRLLPADEMELCALRKASRAFHSPWEPSPAAGAELDTVEGSVWFRRLLATGRKRNTVRLLLCRNADDVALGLINLNEIVRGAFQSAFLGYWIGAEFARRGFMTEGLALVARHAFEELSLHRLEANVRPENTASVALVKRAGFQLEGYSPRYLKIDGAWRDHERYALLLEDWLERLSSPAS